MTLNNDISYKSGILLESSKTIDQKTGRYVQGVSVFVKDREGKTKLAFGMTRKEIREFRKMLKEFL